MEITVTMNDDDDDDDDMNTTITPLFNPLINTEHICILTQVMCSCSPILLRHSR